MSLQSTADLLATTQTHLSSGKKVNSALDNPTSFFTASALDGRASDINNLLDSIGNGVQVLQAANTGISFLEKLVGNAKSVANQALQTTVGYSSKSTVTSAVITGATANNLLGDPTAYTNTARAAGTALEVGTASANATGSSLISALTDGAVATPTGPANGDTITVNGKTISFVTSGAASFDGSGNLTIGIDQTIDALLDGIDTITGNTTNASTITGGQITLNTGTAADLLISGAALSKLGLAADTTARGGGVYTLATQTLTIASTGNGTATSVTFGTAANQVNTLDELNAALAPNNLQATISTAGAITITTSNDAASATIGTIGGTATPFASLTTSAPVQDAAAQLTRANLVNQYNNIIEQIGNVAQDASYAGVNLLGGDTLKLVFNETGKSTLSITGVNFDPAGLGLRSLAAGTDFVDNNATGNILASLNEATTTLRSQASSLGSNLSIVQIRQDFSRSMIVVLQNGSDNLTLADTNEEAANSQALSTRQSIAVSALSLANQSQQSVLQLLR
jgi:flagellin